MPKSGAPQGAFLIYIYIYIYTYVIQIDPSTKKDRTSGKQSANSWCEFHFAPAERVVELLSMNLLL